MAIVFTKTDLDLAQPLSPSQGLVVLQSYPKSGNTWTRLFFYALQSRSAEIDFDHFSKNISTIDAYKGHFASVTGQDPSLLNLDDVVANIPMVQKYLALRATGREVVKSHTLNGAYSGKPTMNFSVIRSVIYVIRNPLDVAASYAAHMGFGVDDAIQAMATSMHWLHASSADQQVAANQVPQLLGSWSEHVASWTGAPDARLTVVRYEDMKKDSVTQFKRMVDGLGMRKTRAEVAQAVEKTDFAKLQKQEEERGFAEAAQGQRFFRKGEIDSWRDELSDDQAKQIIRDHAFQMNRFGYIPEEYHDFAKGVIADSQTAKQFIQQAKRVQQTQAKNIKRRAKPGKNKSGASQQVAVPRSSVMFPSANKTFDPTKR